MLRLMTLITACQDVWPAGIALSVADASPWQLRVLLYSGSCFRADRLAPRPVHSLVHTCDTHRGVLASRRVQTRRACAP